MGYSPLVGTDRPALEPEGRDNAALGPSDSSDSGSDVAVIVQRGRGDPGMPVDKALDDDAGLPLIPTETSDRGGSGERRSAAGDGGEREGADIGTDRIFDPAAGEDEFIDEEEDPDLAFVDALEASTATPAPGRPNPEPDPPDNPGEPPEPEDETEREERKPGRD